MLLMPPCRPPTRPPLRHCPPRSFHPPGGGRKIWVELDVKTAALFLNKAHHGILIHMIVCSEQARAAPGEDWASSWWGQS